MIRCTATMMLYFYFDANQFWMLAGQHTVFCDLPLIPSVVSLDVVQSIKLQDPVELSP